MQAMFVSATAEFLTCGPVGLGIAEGAYDMAFAYSLARMQHGQSMFDRFQVTRHKLAHMWMDIEELRGWSTASSPTGTRATSSSRRAGCSR
jgi:alkylation response protein AidB-like acyl-CoA dehydrogenase